MTAAQLRQRLELTIFSEAEPSREITGGYAGDLLSWVMGRAESGDAWITIMSNQNIVAVALLADAALVLLAEGVQPDEGVAELARTNGVNLYGSRLPAFRLAAELAALL